MADAEHMLGRALQLIEAVWDMSGPGPWTESDDDKPVDRLPDFSEAAAIAHAEKAKVLLAGFDTIDASLLPPQIKQTFDVARTHATRWSREGDWYWHVFDPLKVGFYAMFAPTAYCGGFTLNNLRKIFSSYRFVTSGDVDRYLGLVSDYTRIVEQFNERTVGQAERGIRIPRVQLEQAIKLVQGLKETVDDIFDVAPERISNVPPRIGPQSIKARIAERSAEVINAFESFLQTLCNPAYFDLAPTTVGMSQYPGGAEIYRELVKLHLTIDMTPEQVHAAGHERMKNIRSQMQSILDEVGFSGTPHEYLDKIGSDPAWRAGSPDEVSEFFQKYIDRISPKLDEYFAFKPKAEHGVAALPPELSGSMTFGFYDPPSRYEPTGRFVFNSENLARNALPNIAALNYHELVPGHHFHIASQRENSELHPMRRASFFNAFNEGWAEYAATLAGEMGMYIEPEEKFGRLMMDAFLTCRLVVDTGMNALGWSLEEARSYMNEYGFMPEAEVKSETIRYSCDIPGQSLAYKLGDTFMMNLRETMRAELGPRFDIRDFHDAVLQSGGLPLPMVAENVQAATARILTGAT